MSRILQFFGQTGTTRTFVDPQNVDNRFVQKSELLKKNIGKERVRTIRSELSMQRQYGFSACNDGCTVDDNVSGRVILTGHDKAAKIRLWNDLKANTDAAIAAGAFDGIMVSLSSNQLIIDSEPTP